MSSSRIFGKSAVFILVLTACYTRSPIETRVPAPTTRIIASVTDSGAVVIGGPVGPGAIEVEGVVATADEAVWNLNLVRVDYRGGTSVIWNRELVSFPRYALSDVREKKVNKTMSWLTAGLITTGVFLASRLFSNLAAGGEDDPPPPPPPN